MFKHVNRTYQRSGMLWEGRFRSCIVQEGAYLVACYRYIELNPVRARMVSQPGDYPPVDNPGSSYPMNGRMVFIRLWGIGPRPVKRPTASSFVTCFGPN